MALLDSILGVGKDPEVAGRVFGNAVQPARKTVPKRTPTQEELRTALTSTGGDIFAQQNLGLDMDAVRKLFSSGRGGDPMDWWATAQNPHAPGFGRGTEPVAVAPSTHDRSNVGTVVQPGTGLPMDAASIVARTHRPGFGKAPPITVSGNSAWVWPDGRPVTNVEASDPSITMEQRRTWQRR
tara:strand:+ start:441 stop:986 length:546 start_codon:yes stop_codon:yes gene_type:complete